MTIKCRDVNYRQDDKDITWCKQANRLHRKHKKMISNYTLFFIRTTNLGTEAKRSNFFLRFEPENVYNIIYSQGCVVKFGRELIVLLDHSFTFFFLPLFILITKKRAKLYSSKLTISLGIFFVCCLKFWLISA